MKGFLKRLGTLAVCMLLVCAMSAVASAAPAENCPGSCSHEAAIGTTHYDTLAEALSAAADGNTVKLLSDVTGAAFTVDKAITLDLGGKTLSGTSTGTEALLTATKNITVTGGTMTTEEGAVVLVNDCSVTIEKTATLLGGTRAMALVVSSQNADVTANIHGKLSNAAQNPAFGTVVNGSKRIAVTIGNSASITATNANAIEMYGSGKLTISGGEISAKNRAIVLNIDEDKTMEVSITGGKFLVEGEKTIDMLLGTNATAPKDFVIGGTYNKLPVEYIPANCRTTDNGDGTYTVTAEYSVSVSGNGGSGSMAAIKADRGTAITLPKCTLTAPAGKHFKAWQIAGQTYAPGASYTVNGDVTLTALWEAHKGGTATCYQKAACSVCGKTYGSTASHKLSASSGYAATCTSGGMIAHSKCSSCGQYFVNGNVSVAASSLTLPALGHDMVTVEGIDATCTEAGLLAHEKCSICGILQADGSDITEDALVIPAAGHALEQIPAVEATCVQSGTKAHQQCSACGLLFVNNMEVTAEDLTVTTAAHVLSDWAQDATTHWKSCTVCGEIFRQHSHMDADGDAACDECGYAMSAAPTVVTEETEEGFSFLFLIPIVVAVAIGAGVAINAAKKKSK